jgi:hypothetical protein
MKPSRRNTHQRDEYLERDTPLIMARIPSTIP